MQDPQIIDHPKPATSQDISKLIPVKFGDYGYAIAFHVQVYTNPGLSKTVIPPELGTIKAQLLDEKANEANLIE